MVILILLLCIFSISLDGSFVLFKPDKSFLTLTEFKVAQQVVFENSFPTAAHFSGWDPKANEEQVINKKLVDLKLEVRAQWVSPTLYAFLSVIAISDHWKEDVEKFSCFYEDDTKKVYRKFCFIDTVYNSLRNQNEYLQDNNIVVLQYYCNEFINKVRANKDLLNNYKDIIDTSCTKWKILDCKRMIKSDFNVIGVKTNRLCNELYELENGQKKKIFC